MHIADYTEDPYEVWTGPQVGWKLTRGQASAYGRKANAAYVLWPMCALFLAGLIDWRRPFSMRTLDLAVCSRSSSRCGASTRATCSGRPR